VKITKSKLKQIVKEELEDIVHEEQEELSPEERDQADEFNAVNDKISKILNANNNLGVMTKALVYLLRDSEQFDRNQSHEAVQIYLNIRSVQKMILKFSQNL
jgi:predicted nuclease with TOPRIM domain